MNKEQVRNSIIKLDADDVMEHFDFTEEEKQQMIHGETRINFDVTRFSDKRIGFIQWDRNTSNFNAFCVPESFLETVCSKNNTKKWGKLSW